MEEVRGERSYIEMTIVLLRWFCLAMAVAAIAYIVWFDGTHVREQWFRDCAGCIDVIRVPFDWDNVGYYSAQVFGVIMVNAFVFYRLKGLGRWYDWCYIFTMIIGLAIMVLSFRTFPAEGRHGCGEIDDNCLEDTESLLLILYIFVVIPANIIALLYFIVCKIYNLAKTQAEKLSQFLRR